VLTRPRNNAAARQIPRAVVCSRSPPDTRPCAVCRAPPPPMDGCRLSGVLKQPRTPAARPERARFSLALSRPDYRGPWLVEAPAPPPPIGSGWAGLCYSGLLTPHPGHPLPRVQHGAGGFRAPGPAWIPARLRVPARPPHPMGRVWAPPGVSGCSQPGTTAARRVQHGEW